MCRSGVKATGKEEIGTFQNAEYPQGLVHDMCHTAELMLQLQHWNSGHLFYIMQLSAEIPAINFFPLGYATFICSCS